MSAIPQLISKFNTMSIKIPKIILIWKNKDNFQLKKESEERSLRSSLFTKKIMKVVLFKTRIFVVQGRKRIEIPDTDILIYRKLIYVIDTMIHLIKEARITAYLYKNIGFFSYIVYKNNSMREIKLFFFFKWKSIFFTLSKERFLNSQRVESLKESIDILNTLKLKLFKNKIYDKLSEKRSHRLQEYIVIHLMSKYQDLEYMKNSYK